MEIIENLNGQTPDTITPLGTLPEILELPSAQAPVIGNIALRQEKTTDTLTAERLLKAQEENPMTEEVIGDEAFEIPSIRALTHSLFPEREANLEVNAPELSDAEKALVSTTQEANRLRLNCAVQARLSAARVNHFSGDTEAATKLSDEALRLIALGNNRPQVPNTNQLTAAFVYLENAPVKTSKETQYQKDVTGLLNAQLRSLPPSTVYDVLGELNEENYPESMRHAALIIEERRIRYAQNGHGAAWPEVPDFILKIAPSTSVPTQT